MRQNELLLLVVSCFALTLIWIGFNLYHAHADTTITEAQNIQVLPITPQFNREAIEALKTRVPVEPLFESSRQPTASSTPAITPVEASVTPTSRITPTDTPEASVTP